MTKPDRDAVPGVHQRGGEGELGKLLVAKALADLAPDRVFETADAYLVEFVNPADGSTRALAELTQDQLVPANG